LRTLLAAAAAHNRACVWDLRGGAGALHVLSHGAPARVFSGAGGTTVRAGRCVAGDEGINALAFIPAPAAAHGVSSCLATAGATGVGLWDTALGAPGVLWLPATPSTVHTRTCVFILRVATCARGCASASDVWRWVRRARCSVNTLAVHPCGCALATGGDDQRAVLYAADSARCWLGDLPQAWLPARGGGGDDGA
jgi:WD40 repeat protein